MFALYRKGFSHVVDGIQCEIVRVELNQIDEYKANGWTDNIQDLNPEKQRQAEAANKAPLVDDGANVPAKDSDAKPSEPAADAEPKKRGRPAKAKTEGAAE